jgi:glycerol kinase
VAARSARRHCSASEIETLASSVPDNGGIYFVPAFSGLFAPYWRSDARGAIVGLSRFNTKAHLARATLEAICFRHVPCSTPMVKDSGVRLEVLKVDGGATVNNTLMQLQADVLGVPVVRPVVAETTALGAAYAAGWPPVSGRISTTCGRTGRWIGNGSPGGRAISATPRTPGGRRRFSGRWTGYEPPPLKE